MMEFRFGRLDRGLDLSHKQSSHMNTFKHVLWYGHAQLQQSTRTHCGAIYMNMTHLAWFQFIPVTTGKLVHLQQTQRKEAKATPAKGSARSQEAMWCRGSDPSTRIL